MPDKPENPPTKIEYIEPKDGIYAIYANNYLINWTAYDLRIRFGKLVNAKEGNVLVVEQSVEVTMSWSQAKDFHLMLGALIAEFERLNSKITLPHVPDISKMDLPTPDLLK